MAFSSTLRDPMHRGRPYKLLRWQHDLTERLFGWSRPDGRRRFTRLNVWIAKKNGKTSWLAFLALYFLLADAERRPGCYVTSATGELAEELYTEALALTDGTPWRRVLDLQRFRRRMSCPLNGGELRAIAASAEGAEGLKGSFVVLDEIHATLKRKPRLYGSLRYAGSGRRQPLTATISTAGDDRQSLPYRLYSRAVGIINGSVIDRHTLAAVWAMPDKPIADVTDDDLRAANPALGEVLDLDQLRDDLAEARSSEFAADDFKRYRLNCWTKRSTAWLDENCWDACQAADLPTDALRGRRGFVGVDLSGTLDLTAACLVVPLEDGRLYVEPHFWLPARGAADRADREMDYPAAAAAGELTLCDGETIDYGSVGAWIGGLAERLGVAVAQVGFDPWKAAELAAQLAGAGLDCVAVKQGWTISEPSAKLEALLRGVRLIHRGSAVMRWCLHNVEIRRAPDGKIRPVKPVEKHLRIDGVIALVNAIYLAMFDKGAGEFFCG